MRPTLYTPDKDELARKFCLLGATDKDLATLFDVSVRTINQWKKEHHSFKDAMNRGKIVADANVADSLYNRAVGVSVELQKAFVDKSGVEHKITVKEEIPGDVNAQRFWLNNRRPKEWREKHSVDVDFSNMTDEQLDHIIDNLIQKQNAEAINTK